MVELQFHGAAREVTGSCHLLKVNGRIIPLDCGLFQGKRSDTRERNMRLPVDGKSMHSVILSHAHIDHCGNLPQLSRQGFKGWVYATAATGQLCQLMLRDAAKIQEDDTQYLNKKRARRGEELLTPLYTMADAERILEQFIGVPYGRPFHVLRHLQATFLHAGHILGAAGMLIECDEESGTPMRLGFSGDIGTMEHPFLRVPEPPEDIDHLILESTYGDRLHPPQTNLSEQLRLLVHRVVQRKGKLIIPAFSIGRTQNVVYHLNTLWNQGKLPRVPVYVDSPLSTNATEIFRQRYECFGEEMRTCLLRDDDPFGFDTLTYIRDVNKSKQINSEAGPMIIISASGMCEAGRILHHLANNVSDPRNTVLLVGYMAENTLGRRLKDHQTNVPILGERYEVRAEVESLDGFSAHADQNDLMRYAHKSAESGRLKTIFLVHGEHEAQETFAAKLRKELPKVKVEIPAAGQSFGLSSE